MSDTDTAPVFGSADDSDPEHATAAPSRSRWSSLTSGLTERLNSNGPRERPPSDERRRITVWALVAFAFSRLLVIAGGGAYAATYSPRPPSALDPLVDLLTSWDGHWYMEVVRDGYPHEVPADITFHQPEARAAFFPIYPMLVRAVNVVLPGDEVTAGLLTNVVLGALVVVMIALLALRLFDAEVAQRTAVLVAVFPGSFVLSFAYSEATMLVLVLASMFLVLDRRWLAAGVVAAVATASRPNAIALCAALGVAAIVDYRENGWSWRPWLATAMSPIGFVAFQLFIGRHAGEREVWFRIQDEAWDEGASFGFAAVNMVGRFLLRPLSSPTAVITSISVVVIVATVIALLRSRIPAFITVYAFGIVFLMLMPSTVTARPRFIFTAFPLIMAVAAVWPAKWRAGWEYLLMALAGGLAALTMLYGVLGAVP